MGGVPDQTQVAALQQQARELPDAPGVYLFKDEEDRVLYVGKALSLRSRVGSYFTASTDLGPRKQPMLELIRGIDIIETELGLMDKVGLQAYLQTQMQKAGGEE